MKKIVLFFMLFFTLGFLLISCEAGEGSTALGEMVWSDGFESSNLTSAWYFDSLLDDGSFTVTDVDASEGTYSAVAVSMGEGKKVGNQIYIDITNYEDAGITFSYKVDSIGTATFGLWDMAVSTNPVWVAEGSVTGWQEYTYRFVENTNGAENAFWFGIVGGTADTDKAYIDEVKVYGSCSVNENP